MRWPPEMTSGPVRAPRVVPRRRRHRRHAEVPAGLRPSGAAGALDRRRRAERRPPEAARRASHRVRGRERPNDNPRDENPPRRLVDQKPRRRTRHRRRHHVAPRSFAAAGGSRRSKPAGDPSRRARPERSGGFHPTRQARHRPRHRPKHASGESWVRPDPKRRRQATPLARPCDADPAVSWK